MDVVLKLFELFIAAKTFLVKLVIGLLASF